MRQLPNAHLMKYERLCVCASSSAERVRPELFAARTEQTYFPLQLTPLCFSLLFLSLSLSVLFSLFHSLQHCVLVVVFAF